MIPEKNKVFVSAQGKVYKTENFPGTLAIAGGFLYSLLL